MYAIYEICPSRGYFNFILFNIIAENDYILLGAECELLLECNYKE